MRLALVLAIALTAVACRKSTPEAAPAAGAAPAPAIDASVPAEPAAILAKLESYRDAACACAEPACVHGVERELRNWLLREGPALNQTKATPAQTAAADKVMAAMEACVGKILRPTGQP